MNERPRCDFCSQEGIRWTFPARDFESSVIPINAATAETMSLRSGGGWAACQRCYELVLSGDRNGLADRSARLCNRQGTSLREVRAAIRQLQDDFWANREGEPVPSEPDEVDDPTR